jgi:hypothetical protein
MYRELMPTLAQIAITYIIVWYLHGLAAQFLSGWTRTLVVIVVAIPVWLLVNRLLTSTGVLADESE